MQDAQRIDRILADISLCGRLDDSDVRSIVQRLRDHCFENVQVSLDQCLGWLDDDIGEEPELSSIDSKQEKLELRYQDRGEYDMHTLRELRRAVA
jgi:hypothetical protein